MAAAVTFGALTSGAGDSAAAVADALRSPAGTTRLARASAGSTGAERLARLASSEQIAREQGHAAYKAAVQRARRQAARQAAARQAARRASQRAAASQPPAGRQSAPAPSAPIVDAEPAGAAQQTALSMLGSFGWPASQFGCLKSLWNEESGWRVTASNPSGAYGIPQALPGSKMASAGPDWQTDAATQIRWGLGYIKGLYGSPCGAWAHEQAAGWY